MELNNLVQKNVRFKFNLLFTNKCTHVNMDVVHFKTITAEMDYILAYVEVINNKMLFNSRIIVVSLISKNMSINKTECF